MQKRAIVFDTETTDLVKHPSTPLDRQPHIIEFGCAIIDWETEEVVESFEFLINPGFEISEETTRITGITNGDLIGKPSFKEVLPHIERIFASVQCRVAHNLAFDEDVVNIELRRLEVENFPWCEFSLCTVQENVPRFGRRPKLTELYERVTGQKFVQQHRALDDCMKLAEIVIEDRYLDTFFPPSVPATPSQD